MTAGTQSHQRVHFVIHGKRMQEEGGRATLTCGAAACCGHPEYGTTIAFSHARSGTLHVALFHLRHLRMHEAGEHRGPPEIPSACRLAGKRAGMSASVWVAARVSGRKD